MKPYEEFLEAKNINDYGNGFEVDRDNLNPMLFEFQKDVTAWSLRIGRSLIGLNCGLGKGPIQLEWLKQINEREGKPVIMFCPPGVKMQFQYEAEKFGYDVNIVAENSDIINGINITNYERLIVRTKIEPYEKEIYFKRFKDYEPIEIRRTVTYNQEGNDIKKEIKALEDEIEGIEEARLTENVPESLNEKYKDKERGIVQLNKNLKDNVLKINIEVERFRFNPTQFAGIALDEASILKHWGAKTRERLTRFAASILYRICATATPAPNDIYELSNYAEFLGIMRARQIKAQYFIQDGNTSNKFRLMKPAILKWWQFVAKWAIIIEKPSDIGYSDEGYNLPDMETKYHILKDGNLLPGRLIAMSARTLSEQSAVKRKTVQERCEEAAKVATVDSDHKLIFVRRNDEGILLNKLIPGSVELAGRHKEAYKEEVLIKFARGEIKTLITKPEIGGYGLNFQNHCHRIISVNVNYSAEDLYQYERRVYRFGQDKKVRHDIIAMDTEGDIINVLGAKIRATSEMTKEIISHMDIHDLSQEKTKKEISGYKEDKYDSEYWQLLLGDSCQRAKELDDRSLDTIITSVPFPAMYAYTNFDEDIGNYETAEELCEHLKYVFIELLPKMKPGAIAHIHIAQGVAFQNRHGYMGLWDFRGPLVKMMQDAGWEFYSEITIEKDPQTQAARNHSYQLMQQTVFKDAASLGASVPDYLILFKAPGEKERVTALLSDPEVQGKYNSPDGWITMDMWINWASNVWLMYRKGMKWWEGINVTRVMGAILNNRTGERDGFGIRSARDEEDEKHLCELQLDIIERCVAIHTKPGDLVCDPFNGIGSTGYQSLIMGRRYIGLELKRSYWLTAIKNLEYAENKVKQQKFDLFSMSNIDVGGDEMMKRHKQWMTDRGISLYDRATKWHGWEIKKPEPIAVAKSFFEEV